MAVFPFTVINTPPASVTVTMANYSYEEFLNSLGSYVYLVDKMYLYSLDSNQINQVMLFTKYDANGNQYYNNLTPQIDPFQENSNSYLFATKQNDLILDGLSRLSFMLFSNQVLVIDIYAERRSIPEYLDNVTENNYIQVETAMGIKNLFENYTEKIGWKE